MGVQSHRILHQSLSCLKAHHILQHTGGEPLMLKSILYVILFPCWTTVLTDGPSIDGIYTVQIFRIYTVFNMLVNYHLMCIWICLRRFGVTSLWIGFQGFPGLWMKKQVNKSSSDYVVPWLADQQHSNNLLFLHRRRAT